MNWPAIFLGCFVIGFVLSALSFALGVVDAHVHVPVVHHLHVPHGAHGVTRTRRVSPINFATLMAFLAWFGGTGYLLTSEFRWLARAGARRWRSSSACVGAAIVFWVMAQRAVVAAREHAERRLPHGRRARPPQPADSRRAASAS